MNISLRDPLSEDINSSSILPLPDYYCHAPGVPIKPLYRYKSSFWSRVFYPFWALNQFINRVNQSTVGQHYGYINARHDMTQQSFLENLRQAISKAVMFNIKLSSKERVPCNTYRQTFFTNGITPPLFDSDPSLEKQAAEWLALQIYKNTVSNCPKYIVKYLLRLYPLGKTTKDAIKINNKSYQDVLYFNLGLFLSLLTKNVDKPGLLRGAGEADQNQQTDEADDPQDKKRKFLQEAINYYSAISKESHLYKIAQFNKFILSSYCLPLNIETQNIMSYAREATLLRNQGCYSQAIHIFEVFLLKSDFRRLTQNLFHTDASLLTHADNAYFFVQNFYIALEYLSTLLANSMMNDKPLSLEDHKESIKKVLVLMQLYQNTTNFIHDAVLKPLLIKFFYFFLFALPEDFKSMLITELGHQNECLISKLYENYDLKLEEFSNELTQKLNKLREDMDESSAINNLSELILMRTYPNDDLKLIYFWIIHEKFYHEDDVSSDFFLFIKEKGFEKDIVIRALSEIVTQPAPSYLKESCPNYYEAVLNPWTYKPDEAPPGEETKNIFSSVVAQILNYFTSQQKSETKLTEDKSPVMAPTTLIFSTTSLPRTASLTHLKIAC
jgi:hypothetical protein